LNRPTRTMTRRRRKRRREAQYHLLPACLSLHTHAYTLNGISLFCSLSYTSTSDVQYFLRNITHDEYGNLTRLPRLIAGRKPQCGQSSDQTGHHPIWSSYQRTLFANGPVYMVTSRIRTPLNWSYHQRAHLTRLRCSIAGRALAMARSPRRSRPRSARRTTRIRSRRTRTTSPKRRNRRRARYGL